MSAGTPYTLHHPRWHRTRVSTYWWLGRRSYFLFILRELSSIFVGWSAVYLLTLVAALGEGEAAYAGFLEWSRDPTVLSINIVGALFVALHAVTWFNLAPQAMVVHVGHRRVPGSLIALSNYAGLAAVTALILALLFVQW